MNRPNGLPATTRTAKVAVILAGGKSERFGANKAWATYQGKSLITILIDQLKEARCEIILSGPKAILAPLKLPVIEDPTPFAGPLYALAHILPQVDSEKILLAACDMPFLRPTITDLLWETSEDHDLAILSSQGQPYPLPGIYHQAILPQLQKLMRQGRRDLKALFEVNLKIGIIDDEVIKLYDPQRESLININTPHDLT